MHATLTYTAMPCGRLFTKEGVRGYRFGFNGQYKDDEVYGEGNSYTAEFWQYDPRLGRRWNIDPVVKEWESPYACFHNSPLSLIDKNGDDPEESNGDDKRKPPADNGSANGGDLDRSCDPQYIYHCDSQTSSNDGWYQILSTSRGSSSSSDGLLGGVSSYTSLMTGPVMKAGATASMDGPLPILDIAAAGVFIYSVIKSVENLPPIQYSYSVPTSIAVPTTAPKTHANKKDNPGPQVVYEIFGLNTKNGFQKETLKYGVADAKYNTYGGAGNSRPSSQLSKFQQKYPHLMISYTVITVVNNRETALFIEAAAVTLYFTTHGELPKEQKLPFPFK